MSGKFKIENATIIQVEQKMSAKGKAYPLLHFSFNCPYNGKDSMKQSSLALFDIDNVASLTPNSVCTILGSIDVYNGYTNLKAKSVTIAGAAQPATQQFQQAVVQQPATQQYSAMPQQPPAQQPAPANDFDDDIPF